MTPTQRSVLQDLKISPLLRQRCTGQTRLQDPSLYGDGDKGYTFKMPEVVTEEKNSSAKTFVHPGIMIKNYRNIFEITLKGY